MRANVAAVVFAGLCAVTSACASATPAGPTDDSPPTLSIDSPTRGTTVDGESVTVTGHATAADAVHVTVNGTATPVAADGSFTATLTVASGIDVIETHATDAAGNDVRDVRAVLAGPLAASDGTHAAPIGTHASAATLATIGNAMAADARAVDYTAAVQPLNPVYNNTGCLGAKVDISTVSLSDVAVSLVPAPDALDTNVTISDVVVKLHVAYKVACIGGSGTITVTASAAHISGNLGVTAAGGKLATSLPSTSVVLDNFDLQVSGIPSQVTGLFDGIVRGKVESALGSALENNVPAIANAKLAGLLARPFDTKILGLGTQLTVTPTEATLSPTGLFVGVDTQVLVAGGAGGMFVTEPTTSSTTLMAQTHDLGFAIANDLVNQLFAGLWAAGAFDKSVSISSLGPLGALLDPSATKLVLSLSLPPTAATDPSGNLRLAIGDAIISVQDDSGTELQRLALSLQTGISVAATPAGTIAMALDTPTVFAQVLGQVDDGSLPLSAMQVEGIVTGAWGLLSSQAADALQKLPLPSIAGVQLGSPTVNSVGNYVLADIPLQ